MKSPPLISVVIPCYNQGNYLHDAIESVRHSTLTNYEIIVVDDGSTDQETHLALTRAESEGVRVIYQENKGPSAARNHGINVARGQYIHPLDADDMLAPTYLEKAAWVLNNNSDIGVVTAWQRNYGLNDFIWHPPETNISTISQANTVLCSSMFRKEAWEDAGGYDESFKIGYEDYDFWLSILERDWKIFLIPEILFYYQVKPVSKFTIDRTRHNEIMRVIKTKHPKIFERSLVWGLPAKTAIKNKLRYSFLGRFIISHFWRDALVLRDKGFVAWLKWRLFPVVKTVPGMLPAYRKLKRGNAIIDTSNIKGTDKSVGYNLIQVKGNENKIGILYLVPWLQMGGADKVNLDLIKSLDRKCYHPVIVTTLKDRHPWHETFCKQTQDVFHLANLESNREGMLNFLNYIIKTRNIQIIQISNSLDGYYLLSALKDKYGLPVVSLVHTYVPSEPWDYARIATEYDKWIDVHIAVSHTLAEQMVALGCPRDKVVTILNGVDTERFKPGKNDWVVKNTGVSYKKLITFIGRFAYPKQPVDFVLMAEELVWSIPVIIENDL